MITLAQGADVLRLPDDLVWTDEFAWSAVAQSATHTVTGALIVQATARQRGRPVTLAGTERAAWAPRSLIEQLRSWASAAGPAMRLTLHDARAFDVVFRHGDGAGALEARPIVDYADPAPGDAYALTVRLMEV